MDAVRRVARGDLAVSSDVAFHLATAVRDDGAVRRVKGLSPRELEVLRLLATGVALDQIAESLGISVKTIQSHRKNLRTKLKVQTDAALCLTALKAGMVSLRDTA